MLRLLTKNRESEVSLDNRASFIDTNILIIRSSESINDFFDNHDSFFIQSSDEEIEADLVRIVSSTTDGGEMDGLTERQILVVFAPKSRRS